MQLPPVPVYVDGVDRSELMVIERDFVLAFEEEVL